MDRPDDGIRRFQPGDEVAVADVWHRAGRAAYPYLPSWQTFEEHEARRVFREVILARCDLYVGERHARVVAFMAMRDACVDRLYVDPTEQRRGWGTRLVELAKRRQPGGLSLHTHQQNHVGRRFYEKHGFRAVRFGISPAPESAPDVEYRWSPDGVRESSTARD